MAGRPSRFQQFCRHSTVRGVPKIVSSKSRFLRSMWFLFVITMFLVLNVSAIRIILNYLEYHVTIQTKVRSPVQHKFPALTLCNHNPFSKRAPLLWNNDTFPSPTKYNWELRQLSRRLIEKGEIDKAKDLQGYDSISLYYQSLTFNAATTLGHSKEEMISNCMIINGNAVTLGDYNECGLKVKLLSHFKYFNCYTVEPKEEISKYVSSLYLIVDLGRHPNPNIYQQAFFMDVFEQAYGLRIQIHESGNFPNMEKEAMHIEPGKMVEISYSTTEWNVEDTPKQHCYETENLVPIEDLGQEYHYTREACIDQHVADYVRKTCGCVFARRPRRKHPEAWDPPLPYCGDIDSKDVDSFFNRLHCFATANVTEERKRAFDVLCLPRCVEHKYPNHFSVTQWRSSGWQMHWRMDQNRAWKNYEKAERKNDSRLNESLERIMRYLKKENLSFIDTENKYINDPLAYAYIVLRRNNFDLTVKTEKLNLNLEALLSRLGGLCSLCLGLTCAFVFELVEFCYLLTRRRKDHGHPISERNYMQEENGKRKTEGLI